MGSRTGRQAGGASAVEGESRQGLGFCRRGLQSGDVTCERSNKRARQARRPTQGAIGLLEAEILFPARCRAAPPKRLADGRQCCSQDCGGARTQAVQGRTSVDGRRAIWLPGARLVRPGRCRYAKPVIGLGQLIDAAGPDGFHFRAEREKRTGRGPGGRRSFVLEA